MQGQKDRYAILTRLCVIHPGQARCTENGMRDPGPAHPDPRRSANIPIAPVAVSVVVPARGLQTQPSSVRQASDIALSNCVARKPHPRKAFCCRHPPGKPLSFACCRVSTGPLLMGANRQTSGPAGLAKSALIASFLDHTIRVLPCDCAWLSSSQSGDFPSHFSGGWIGSYGRVFCVQDERTWSVGRPRLLGSG